MIVQSGYFEEVSLLGNKPPRKIDNSKIDSSVCFVFVTTSEHLAPHTHKTLANILYAII